MWFASSCDKVNELFTYQYMLHITEMMAALQGKI
jgi:hypothetical protein